MNKPEYYVSSAVPKYCDDRLRIGVFFGGMSIEREVSFNSGRTVCERLDSARFDIIPLYQTATGTLAILPLHFLHRGKTTDFEHRLPAEATYLSWEDLQQHIDLAFIALHGRYGEDGALQSMLELINIPYIGSKRLASAQCRNKTLCKRLLAHKGIQTPSGITLCKKEIRQILNTNKLTPRITDWLARTPFPLIVKPEHEGSSLGITVAHTPETLQAALTHATYIAPQLLQPVLIEEQIKGMEFSCIVIISKQTKSWQALSVTEIVPEDHATIFDYEQKYMPGKGTKFTPARCSASAYRLITETCINTAQALCLSTLGRIDGFLTPHNEVIIIDVNTLGGMAPASFTFLQAAEQNMSPVDLINHLVDTTLQEEGFMLPPDRKNAIQKPGSKQLLRVAVLLGGSSAEREISLDSGRNVLYKLSPHLYEAIPLFVNGKNELFRINQKLVVKNKTVEIEAAVHPGDKVLWTDLPFIADFVFIALHGGAGENGQVQGALELLRLPYNGSSIATSALCMDKHATAHFLRAEGFQTPQQLLVSTQLTLCPEEWREKLNQAGLVCPLIIKPPDDGCSVLVDKIASAEWINQTLDAMKREGRATALLENYISGMELTVGVMGNDEPVVLPLTHTVATQGILSIEEKFLPGTGENRTPAPLSEQATQFVQNIIGDAYKVLGCKGYARIDCFYQSAEESSTGKETVIILEVNTLPGLTPATCLFHQAAEVGIRPMELIDRIIQYGLEEHQMLNAEASNAVISILRL